MSSQSKTLAPPHPANRARGVIVSEMGAPVRFRRKALAVAGAFVVASAAAACSAGASQETPPSPPESPRQRRLRRRTPRPHPSPTPSAKPSATAVQKVNADYKKFDPKNFEWSRRVT